jgi:hypothetical protein
MIKRLGAGKRHSMATIHGGLVDLAGQVPNDLFAGNSLRYDVRAAGG